MQREFNIFWQRIISRIDSVRQSLGLGVNWEEEMYLRARPGDKVWMRIHGEEGIRSKEAIVGQDKLLEDPARTDMLTEYSELQPGTRVDFYLLRRRNRTNDGFEIIRSYQGKRNSLRGTIE